MDDVFLPLLNSIDIETFIECLNSLHPRIMFTKEDAAFTVQNEIGVQLLNFLDITIILDERNIISTGIYSKT